MQNRSILLAGTFAVFGLTSLNLSALAGETTDLMEWRAFQKEEFRIEKLREEGKTDLAIREYEKLRKKNLLLRGQKEVVESLAALYLQKKQARKALELITSLESANTGGLPGNPAKLTAAKAQAWFLLGDRKTALRLYTSAIAQTSTTSIKKARERQQYFLERAQVFDQMGAHDRAEKDRKSAESFSIQQSPF